MPYRNTLLANEGRNKKTSTHHGSADFNAKDIDPFRLSSLSLEERDNLPSVGGIYFAILDSSILYIGKSTNLQQRWNMHHRAAQFQSRGEVRIAWLALETMTEEDLARIEKVCIEHFHPSLNETVVETDMVTTKIRQGSLKKLKIIAATTGERMTDVLQCLIDAELLKTQGGQKEKSDMQTQD